MSSSSEASKSSRSPSKPTRRSKIGGIFSKLKGKVGSLTKKVFRRRKKEKTSIQDEEEEKDSLLLLKKWTCACFNSCLVADVNQMNYVFSPVTTLSCYVALTLALHRDSRHALRDLFSLPAKTVEDFGVRLTALSPLNPEEAFFFLRLITNSQEDALVSDKYLRLVSGYLGPYTIIRLDPAEVPRHVAELSGNLVNSHRPWDGRTTGFCPASLRTQWNGETSRRRIKEAPFLMSYCGKQKHLFFQLTSVCNTITTPDFEAWSLPISTASGRSFSLVLLRPHLVGCLLEMRKQLTAGELRNIFNGLDEEEAEEHRLLLPSCCTSVSEDIWARWTRNYPPFCTLENESPMPPLDHIWHTAVFSMSSRGVGFNFRKRLNPPTPVSTGRRFFPSDLSHCEVQYSARLDSPFLFFVNLENHVTLLAGCYMGSPPPKADAICMPIPEEIRLKPPPREPKKKSKCCRKKKKKKKKALRRQSKSRSFFSKMATSVKKKVSSISKRFSKSSKRKNKTSK